MSTDKNTTTMSKSERKKEDAVVATTPPATTKTTKKKHPAQHLIAGGTAGLVESCVCHPLDTIKTRLQLRRNHAPPPPKIVESAVTTIRHSLVEPALRMSHSLQEPKKLVNPSSAVSRNITTTVQPKAPEVLGPIGIARRIIQREGFFALYKGLSAVVTGIVPKMAIRFLSFEQYKEGLTSLTGKNNSMITFSAGLASGLTEAILVVTPAEVCKIRMQSQYHSLMDPTQLQQRKYRGVLHTAFTIVREEGIGALYKGLMPTMLRQGCNQAVNFTAYHLIKKKVMDYQNSDRLEHWQSLMIGGISGGMGPLVNNPLDVVKTRLQKQVITPGKTPRYTGLVQATFLIGKEEGVASLWKGITPRLLRIMPGQAITFMTYEAVSAQLYRFGFFN